MNFVVIVDLWISIVEETNLLENNTNMNINVEKMMRNIVVREFDPNKDCFGVEEVERRCEVGPSGKLCLFTDLLGDPVCRVRNSPAFLMLVLYSTLFVIVLPLL